MRRLKLEAPVLRVLESLLEGQRPTAKRVLGLLGELTRRRASMEEAKMLDEQDRELGRVPHRASDHARLLNKDPDNLEAAQAGLAEAQTRREAQARERIQEKIAENEAKGLHRTAPAIEEEPLVETERPKDAIPDLPEHLRTTLPPSPPDQPVDEAAEIERRKTAGMRRTREVAEQLERGFLQKMPGLRLQGRTLKTLEDAAEVLIGELQPNHQDAIRQVAQEYSMDAWVVILGAVARMADLQELHAGEFEDHWKNRQGSGATAASAKVEICQMCGGEMAPDPIRKNRVACCNAHGSGKVEHSDGCALSHLKMVAGQWVDAR